ncbi:MAG: proline dehydrogenase family protein [Armatimonadetes bacterium]|nr:proline dehydrogenase family protein [Armatimonadota bacterium]
MIFRTLILKSATLAPVEKFVRGSRLFRPIVNRFIAGETADSGIQVAESLAREGFFVTLDLLGENVHSEEAANQAADNYIDLLHRIAASSECSRINISIKLTALGLDQSGELAEANYRRLLEAAEPAGIFIRADMEGSLYTQRTIELVRKVRSEFPNTGTVLQSYLYRTDQDLETLIGDGCRVRIVKGAYLESPEIAYPAKADVDRQYVEQAKKLLVRGRYPAIASHDAGIIDSLRQFVARRKIAKSSFEWQMLFGIRRDLQAALRDEGYNVRVYLPFGEAWYPYFTRRLAERPANLLFIARSLFQK